MSLEGIKIEDIRTQYDFATSCPEALSKTLYDFGLTTTTKLKMFADTLFDNHILLENEEQYMFVITFLGMYVQYYTDDDLYKSQLSNILKDINSELTVPQNASVEELIFNLKEMLNDS